MQSVPLRDLYIVFIPNGWSFDQSKLSTKCSPRNFDSKTVKTGREKVSCVKCNRWRL